METQIEQQYFLQYQQFYQIFDLNNLILMLKHPKKFISSLDTVLKASLITQAPYAKLSRPLNIAHRGLAGLFPQNTKQAFEAALYSGADFIELDVVFTKDDHLLVMHDPYLRRITNVEGTDLAKITQKRFYASEQREINDGWTDRFTLEQLRKLTVKQNQAPNRITSLDWHFGFPTLDEVIELVKKFNKLHKGRKNPDGKIGGILIEAKDGDMYRNIYGDKKISIGKKILDVLKDHGIETWQKGIQNNCPIYLHSFDAYTVEQWHKLGSNLPRNLLVEESTHPKDFKFLDYVKQASKYCHGVGLQSTFLWDYQNGKPKSDVVRAIKKLEMMLHIWTFKDDDLLFGAKNNHEMYRIGENTLKLDGIITEFPDIYGPISHYLGQQRALRKYRKQQREQRQQKEQIKANTQKKEQVSLQA